MKKRQEETKNNNVGNEELKVLAKAFVTAAIEEGLTATKIYEIVRVVWNELIDEVQPKLVLPEETEEEKEFRKKAIELIKDNPKTQDRRIHDLNYEENGEKESTNAVLELLCAMNKVFNSDSDEAPSRAYIKSLAKHRLKAIGGKEYFAATEVDVASRRITDLYESIFFNYYSHEGFENFCKQYYSRRNSISHEILTIEWYIKAFY